MALFNDDELIELRQKVDLRLIVAESYSPKSTKGKAYKFHCPFHDDRKHPNLSVYADGYYCRACGADGSVYHWLMHVNRISFPQAVKIVQEMTGESLNEGSRPQLKAELYRTIGMDPVEMRKIEGSPEWLDIISEVSETLYGRISWLLRQPITASERNEAELFRSEIRDIYKQARIIAQTHKQAPA
jgi:hypothetical protein